MIFPVTPAQFYLTEANLDLLATVQARHHDSENMSFEGLPGDLPTRLAFQEGIPSLETQRCLNVQSHMGSLSEDLRAKSGILRGTTRC